MEPTSIWVISLVMLAYASDGSTHRIEPPNQGYFRSAADCRAERPSREEKYMRTDGLQELNRLGRRLGLRGELDVRVYTICMQQPYAVA
jgi:hypothetical protein